MAFIRGLMKRTYRPTYSQCGEDVIVRFILDTLEIPTPAYLDIGANDPVALSNTYLFYRQGARGICIEPDPVLFEKLRRKRKRDICLNVGIGTEALDKAPFYLMSDSTLNTFSKEEAERYQRYGTQKIVGVMDVPLVPINAIMEKYCPAGPNYVSLDVEGMDGQILGSFDFARFRPQVFCIETLTYTEDKSERKVAGIPEFMASNGYMNYADTYINTIFVDAASWARR